MTSWHAASCPCCCVPRLLCAQAAQSAQLCKWAHLALWEVGVLAGEAQVEHDALDKIRKDAIDPKLHVQHNQSQSAIVAMAFV